MRTELNLPINITTNVSRPLFLVMLRTVLFAAVQLVIVFSFSLSWSDSIAWWPFYAIISNLICSLVLTLLALKEGMTFRDIIHFQKNKLTQDFKSVWWVFLAAGIAGGFGLSGLGFLMYGSMMPPDAMIQPLPVWAAIIALMLFPITNALVEIPIYMGYCLPRLEVALNSTWKSVAICSFFLAFQHFTLPLLISDVKYMTWHFVGMIPLALTVGIIYIKIRRLVPIMIVHWFMDIAAVLGVVTLSIS